MKRNCRSRVLRVALVTGVLLAVAGGVAYATIPDAAGVYTACKLNALGTIRLIDPALPSTSLLQHCNTSFETQISWNQQGQPGPQGPRGVTGDTGAQGLKGDKGDQGIQGAQGLKGDTGAPGAAGLKGDKGDPGATGSKGDKGDPGAPGANGTPCVKADGTLASSACQGPTGSQGPAGPPGSGTLRYVESRWEFLPAGTSIYEAVFCDQGEGWRAISGGVSVEHGASDIHVVDSHPEGADLHGWGVTVANSAIFAEHVARFFAICVPPGTSLQTFTGIIPQVVIVNEG
jgi:hypothetical protein